MAAKNDHTGDLIISRALSKQGRINHDRIYAKKPSTEWLKEENIRLLDLDGWREGDGILLETPITYKDFCHLLNRSTIINLNV